MALGMLPERRAHTRQRSQVWLFVTLRGPVEWPNGVTYKSAVHAFDERLIRSREPNCALGRPRRVAGGTLKLGYGP